MSDAGFEVLLPFLRGDSSPALLFADENLRAAVERIEARPRLRIITNRYDVYQRCRCRSLDAVFSDYACDDLATSGFQRLVYRVSKEKPVVHHIINQSLRLLRPGGQLLMAGAKGDGIKTYTDKAAALLGDKSSARKHGDIYLAQITRSASADVSQRLDDRDYTRLRSIGDLQGKPVFSKPGVFGWEKTDAGSRLLVDSAAGIVAELQPESLLDLGCGYGYLTLCSQAWNSLKRRVATDNSAAALRCMRHNAEIAGLEVEVLADDAGAGIDERFTLVVCNPPFHQGFSVDSDLTRKFLQNAHRLLHPQGSALFVVNQFIGIEKAASRIFRNVDCLSNNGRFKVLLFSK